MFLLFGDRVSSSLLLKLPLFLLIASFYCLMSNAQVLPNGVALSSATQWTNNPTAISSFNFSDGSTIRPILLTRISMHDSYTFGCGFYCNGDCLNYMFAIYIIQTGTDGRIYDDGYPQVVWSANRNLPVKTNSTLALTSDGDLSLTDSDATVVWSTNTAGKSAVGMNLTVEGNLVLFDKNNATIWQSFDYPTDTLVLGQRLTVGQKMTASVSSENWTQVPLLSFTLNKEELVGLMETDPPQLYYANYFGSDTLDTSYVQYENGSLSLFKNSLRWGTLISLPVAFSSQYIRLDSVGHLKAFEPSADYNSFNWEEVADLLSGTVPDCGYPLSCGTYGICASKQCSCPSSFNSGNAYFKQNDDRKPNFGCSLATPLSCEARKDQSFVELKEVFYLSTFMGDPDLKSVDLGRCKQACIKKCSCKSAIFQYEKHESSGNCYLPSEIFTLLKRENGMPELNYTIYIKVQNVHHFSEAPPVSNMKRRAITLNSSLAALFVFILLLLIGSLIWRRRKCVNGHKAEEEDYFDQFPEMPSRFSYEDLNAATQNFSEKLGSGGFGSVFKGILLDGTQVAVKKLEGSGHLKDSFLAEVKTIGSIHHVNLVRLVGFCAEKLHRLLVYEYMANGSLDQWIFYKKKGLVLEWKQRKKIILDIANGIHYLHEGCRQKILHLDIKPQNILLDENFGAKVADFGLSKLIDRDQSQVITTMKGTPGYLAPEWLSSVISEKVDVYSFGVVILEVICGRKVFDDSLVDEEKYLPGLLKRKAQEDKLLDMVDKYSEDMQLHGLEAVDMMKVAAWCLQGDFAKRPSMAMITKVLSEGFTDLRVDLDFNLSSPTWVKVTEGICQKGAKMGLSTILLLPSVLSGPR